MQTRHIKSWLTVLLLFGVVVLCCAVLSKFVFGPPQTIQPQLVSESGEALAMAADSVVSLWAVKKQGTDTHVSVFGCGVVVDSRGYILTTAQLAPDIESLYVVDSEGGRHEAIVVTDDKTSRLVLLKASVDNMTGAAEFVAAQLGESDRLEAGDLVMAIGGKRTLSSWELTTKDGRITDTSQSLVIDKSRYRDLVQTDVLMTSENLGGPLVNTNGVVVGFCIPDVKPPGGPAEVGYAVSVSQARGFLAALPIPHWTDGPAEPVCTWLGAELLPLNPVVAAHLSVPHSRGELVNHITNNSPAKHAGLKRGDVVTAVNGEAVTDRSFFDEMAPQLCQSDQVELSVIRAGRQKTLTVDWNQPQYTLGTGGSLAEVVLVVLIFTLIYYMVYRNVFDRVVLFVFGALVIAVIGHQVGFYGQNEIASALLSKIDVLCFIVGMQLITAVLEEAGALVYLAKKITLATSGNRWRIMWLFCLITYGFSLVVNNLTTIMLMAPMMLKLSKYLDCDPKPFLISMVVASNLGGASTMVGDFPNMLIATETGLAFGQFIRFMLPICLLELGVLMVYLRFARPSVFAVGPGSSFLRAAHGTSDSDESDLLGLDDGSSDEDKKSDFFDTIKQSLPNAIKNRRALNRGLIILAAVVVGFLISDRLRCSPAVIALVGGIIALGFGACEPISLLQKVSIRDILFFCGLFVLVGAAEASGALGYIAEGIVNVSFGNLLVMCLLLMWTAAAVTCFLNAGPAAALFLPVVLSFKSAVPHNLYWWSLSLGVCAGSSGTLVGATAGSVTATMFDRFRKKHGKKASSKNAQPQDQRRAKLTFQEYASLGLPIMFIFLFISSIYVILIYRW